MYTYYLVLNLYVQHATFPPLKRLLFASRSPSCLSTHSGKPVRDKMKDCTTTTVKKYLGCGYIPISCCMLSEVLIRDINNNSNNFDDISLNKMISDSAGNSFENSGNSSGAGSPDSTDSNNGSDKAIEGLSKSHEDIREILSSIEDKEITASQTDLFIQILQTFKELVETLEETDVNGVRNLLYKLLPSIIY